MRAVIRSIEKGRKKRKLDQGVVTSEKDPATFSYRWYLQ